MNLKPFRKSNQNKKFYPGSYAHLRQRVPKKRQQLRIILPKKRILILTVSIIALTISILFFVYFIQTSDNFTVKTVKFEGDEISEELKSEIINQVQGQNIFNLNISQVEASISDRVENLNSAIVTKAMPDRVRIFIDKYTPTLISISFDSLEVFDENLELVYQEDLKSGLTLTEIESKSLEGTVVINSNEFQEYVISNLSEEEKEGFNWDQFTDERKQEFAERLQSGIDQKMSNHFNENLTNISERFAGAQIVNYYDFLMTNESPIAKEQRINSYRFTINLSQEISRLNLVIAKLEWLSRSTLKITLDSNKFLYFSQRREVQDQIIDLETALVNGILNSASNIDFRTVNFSSWN